MTEFVRVQQENGHEVTLPAEYVAGLGDDAPKVLDVPATNSRGVPLSATRKNGRKAMPKTTVKNEAAKKTARKSASPAPSDTTTTGGVAVTPEEAPE